ncbi:MAG: nuclear transport factor 2 family protein [Pseudomonadota bacterium]|nr:nuclear transport factor 2 family protein [Pseudomonadota bacterium]
MGIEGNKRVVQTFMGLFETAAIARALEMMTDDATWEVVGKAHLYDGVGVHTRDQMARGWLKLFETLKGGLQMRVTNMIGEGDFVVAEVRSDATTRTGKRYENDYHFLIAVRDGRIARVKEYTDLMHAAEVFG